MDRNTEIEERVINMFTPCLLCKRPSILKMAKRELSCNSLLCMHADHLERIETMRTPCKQMYTHGCRRT